MAWYDLNEREFSLVLGLLCLIFSIFFGYHEINKWFERDEGDYSLNSSTIGIMTGVIGLFVIGVIGVIGVYKFFN